MNEEKKLRLTVASSPHVASPIDTTNLMRDVLIALVPAMVMGVVFFGPRALVATIISVVACLIISVVFGTAFAITLPSGLLTIEIPSLGFILY